MQRGPCYACGDARALVVKRWLGSLAGLHQEGEVFERATVAATERWLPRSCTHVVKGLAPDPPRCQEPFGVRCVCSRVKRPDKDVVKHAGRRKDPALLRRGCWRSPPNCRLGENTLLRDVHGVACAERPVVGQRLNELFKMREAFRAAGLHDLDITAGIPLLRLGDAPHHEDAGGFVLLKRLLETCAVPLELRGSFFDAVLEA